MAKGGGGAAREATRVGRPKATTVSRSGLGARGAARVMAGRPGGANKTYTSRGHAWASNMATATTGHRPGRVTRAGK